MLKNVYAFFGSDEGKASQHAQQKFNELAGEMPGSNDDAEIIDGGAVNAEELGSVLTQCKLALQSVSMFSTNKLVWLKNVSFLAGRHEKSAQINKSTLNNFTNFLEGGFPKSTFFVFSGREIDKRTSFYKLLSKKKRLQIFDKIDESKSGWQEKTISLTKEIADEYGLSFSQNDNDASLYFFINCCGSDSKLIKNEMEKLSIFLDDKKILDLQSLRALLPRSQRVIIFEVGEALGQGDAQKAIEMCEQLLAGGKRAMEILHAAIIPRVRSLLYAKILQKNFNLTKHFNYISFNNWIKRMEQKKIAFLPRTSKTKQINAYPIFSVLKNIDNFSLSQLENALKYCLDTNLELVSSETDERLLIEQLLVKILKN